MSYAEDIMEVIATYDGERRTLIDRAISDAVMNGIYKPSEALLRAWLDLRPPTEPVVVNRHHFADGKGPRCCVYVGRPEPLCNPFPRDITVAGFRATAEERGWPQGQIEAYASRYHRREITAIEMHRLDLHLQLQRGGPVRTALEAVTGATALVCSCATSPIEEKSKSCHAFTLVRAWRWLREQKAAA